jgi:hypothetical protein
MKNSIKLLKIDFDLLNKNIEFGADLFTVEFINENECKLTFDNIEKALDFDELIKDRLIYMGFDKDYNPTRFGQICEDIIDKMYKILN